jgi:hypothetical protein
MVITGNIIVGNVVVAFDEFSIKKLHCDVGRPSPMEEFMRQYQPDYELTVWGESERLLNEYIGREMPGEINGERVFGAVTDSPTRYLYRIERQ